MAQLVLNLVDAIDPRRKTWRGRPCLAEENPKLAAELVDQELAWTVTPGSEQKLQWKCRKCSHKWLARVSGRSKGTGCPRCAGKHSKTLAEANPKLASELVDQELAWTVTPGSEQKLQWKCRKCSHKWSARASGRSKGRGCPSCVGQSVTESNCLATINPRLAAELVDRSLAWTVTPKSNKKLQWKCRKCSHKWETSVSHRSNGTGCPSCAGRSVTESNCLATINPDLASELVDQELAKNVTPGSDKKLQWKCRKCSHKWKAMVASRSIGKGCPRCAGKHSKTLAEVNPDLASELVDQELAKTVTPKSNKKLQWKCRKCSHKWETMVANRSIGKGCPSCATSKMNKWSEKVFETLKLDFKMEHRFDECRSRNPLPFDAAIFQGEKVVALFEFQGRQHFEPVEHFGGQRTFAETQKHDAIKRRFAQENGIPLVEISYQVRDQGEKHFEECLVGELTRLQINQEEI